jgi:hypothetical protein
VQRIQSVLREAGVPGVYVRAHRSAQLHIFLVEHLSARDGDCVGQVVGRHDKLLEGNYHNTNGISSLVVAVGHKSISDHKKGGVK